MNVLLGQKRLCHQTLMHPTLADGRLYVPPDREFLYCYDLPVAKACGMNWLSEKP